jgi:23S rRNA pseudouridine2604 synthase
MSFSRRVVYFLVHTLGYTNKEAQALIEKRLVLVNAVPLTGNVLLDDDSEITIGGRVVRPHKKPVYLKFNKPAGYESSLNPAVKNNLATFFEGLGELFIAGRLDKQSEGLLILSNNGKWVEMLCNPKFEKEKEYRVLLDRVPDEKFLEAFRSGVRVGHSISQPCFCERLEGTTIRVILKEGKNRQIRRMCHNLGYGVMQLKRTRVWEFQLDNLAPGKFERINTEPLQ